MRGKAKDASLSLSSVDTEPDSPKSNVFGRCTRVKSDVFHWRPLFHTTLIYEIQHHITCWLTETGKQCFSKWVPWAQRLVWGTFKVPQAKWKTACIHFMSQWCHKMTHRFIKIQIFFVWPFCKSGADKTWSWWGETEAKTIWFTVTELQNQNSKLKGTYAPNRK